VILMEKTNITLATNSGFACVKTPQDEIFRFYLTEIE